MTLWRIILASLVVQEAIINSCTSWNGTMVVSASVIWDGALIAVVFRVIVLFEEAVTCLVFGVVEMLCMILLHW